MQIYIYMYIKINEINKYKSNNRVLRQYIVMYTLFIYIIYIFMYNFRATGRYNISF